MVILTQAVSPQPVSSQDNQEQESSQDAADEQQIAPSLAVPSPTGQINLGYQSYLLAEIFTIDAAGLVSGVGHWIIAPTQKAMEILLRQYISPNAP